MFIFSAKDFYVSACLIFCTSFYFLSAQIIISQYYEGNVNDKFLEITNVSGSAINPSNNNFFICVFSNENAADPSGKKPGLSTKIDIGLSPGETAIYKNSLAVSPVYAVNEGIGALIGAFNGNDLLIIATAKDETAWENRVDVIGNSSDWGIDKSFYRKITVNTPNPTYTPEEWTEITLTTVDDAAENTVERLGYHFYNCQKPTIPSANVSFSEVSDTFLEMQWNNGNGSSRLIVVKANEAVTGLPVDGISYNASPVFGSGDEFDGGFVVYNGWENSLSITDLTPSTHYFISIFEFDCSPPQYLATAPATGNQITLAPVPRVFTALGEEGLDFGLIRPDNSSAASEVVVSWVNLSSDITASVDSPFEISPDQTDWSNQITIPFSESGNESVYIRFSPNKADGIHQKALTLNTSGAEEVSRPLTGTAFPNAWVNEFHYEDIGADEGEFVEIVIQYSENYDLSAIRLLLYNGSSGQVYDQESLDNFVPGEKSNNFTVYSWPVADIQNGQPDGPDGLALSIDDQVITFLSYEGTFTASDGPAAGTTSFDIGLEESNETTAEGLSLQLEDNDLIDGGTQILGNRYEDFVWTTGLESPGLFNSNQVLPVELSNFNATRQNDSAILSWQTLSEVNNRGFEIQKSVRHNQFETIGYVRGHGNSNEPVAYNFTDEKFLTSCYYKLKQIDFDGRFSFSRVISLKRSESRSGQFIVSPNPVRQKLNITTSYPVKTGAVEVQLLSIHGKKILQSKGDLVKIRNQINRCLKYLQRGVYLLKLHNGWRGEKHILFKE